MVLPGDRDLKAQERTNAKAFGMGPQYGPMSTVSKGHGAKLCAGTESEGRQGRRKKAGVKGSRGFSSHSKD